MIFLNTGTDTIHWSGLAKIIVRKFKSLELRIKQRGPHSRIRSLSKFYYENTVTIISGKQNST